MPGFSFEEETGAFDTEYDTQEETESSVQEGAEEVLDQLEGQDNRFSRTMSEVERRFALAECYKLLLQQDLFASATSASVQVQKEIAEFCQHRLEVLMGIKPEGIQRPSEPKQGDFNREELTALRAIAKVALSRGAGAEQPQQQALKAVVTLEAPPPAPKQAIKKARQPAQTPQAAQLQARRPAPKRRIIKEVEGTDLYTGKPKTVKMDITPQASGGHGKPMPSNHEMEAITAAHAARDSQLVTRGIPGYIKQGIANKINKEG